MRTFVTGSTGLLGNNLVRLLIQQGHEVKALARSRTKAERLLGDTGAQIVVGDMNEVDAFASELAGCEVLFHTAAYFRETFAPGDHWENLERLNITNTLHLFEAAERQGVSKVIHTSSVATVGKRADGLPSDEGVLTTEANAESLYARSKVLADRAIASFEQQHKIQIMSILPSWMLGPGDAGPTSGGKFVLDYCNRTLPGIIDSGIEVVDARDVAQAMLNAVSRGGPGERYIISAQYVHMEDLFRTLQEVTGIPMPARHIPATLAYGVAWATERISALTGRESAVSVNGLRAFTEKKRVSAAKARQELQATLRPLTDTMRDTVQWYVAHQPERIASAATLTRLGAAAT